MPSVQIDDQFDMFGGFLAEIEGYLPVIATNVRLLLTSPGNEDLLEESHRFAHTIKSSAAMMGIPELRRVAAPMEALLARAYAGEVAIDEAVAATIDGTLLRIRSCLTLQQAGSNMEALVKENDQAYAGLLTTGLGQQKAPSEDARDRLLHAGVDVAEPFLPSEEAEQAPPAAANENDDDVTAVLLQLPGAIRESGLPNASLAALPKPAMVSGDAAKAESEVAPPERPRLTVLPGRLDTGSGVPNSPATRSIAAEWLAEILGGVPETFASDTIIMAEESEPAAVGPLPHTADGATLQWEWEQRLVTERTALEAQLEQERREAAQLVASERQLHAEQQRALIAQHERALSEAIADRERALLEQRQTLEQEVQRYIEEDLRPQLEEEIRQDVTHEFQLAALLDPAPQAPAATASRPTNAYAYADDPALAAEMREIFAQEAAEHIQAIGEQTLALREQPEDAEHLQALRRSVHTLKGASATVGLTAVSTLCHQIESALDRQLDGGTPPGGVGQTLLLLESCDALEALVRGDAAAGERATTLAQRLSLVTGVAVPAVQPEAAQLLPDEKGGEPTSEPLLVEPKVFAVTVPGAVVEFERDVSSDHAPERATATAGLALRVSLTELDKLLAANHELIITESAMELRAQRLKQTLDDVRHTGDRLRAASGRLETGTRFAAMLAGGPQAALPSAIASDQMRDVAPTWRDALRAGASTASADEFDTLEMDRYTEFHRLTREV
ncbi:MAG TPA: Hpt domain-containing protein, partial [Chloroflexota bacterium]